jgi:hypothetical protein
VPGVDNDTVYIWIRGNSSPGFSCRPYTLSYFFDPGYCR